MPVWALYLAIGYASLLLLAAIWAIVERTRWAMLARKRKSPDPTVRRAAAVER